MKLRTLGLIVLCCGGLRAQPAAPAPAGGSYLPPTVSSRLDALIDGFQAKKTASGVPLGFGAWHWWHADKDKAFHYGTPDASGTFFFFLTADPTKVVTTPSSFVKSYGAHVEARINDGDKFRSFFPSRLWTYDSYVWAYTDLGTFKAGQVWKRFGLDWDGSFWGGTAYFDGFKLNPDWGVSWERTKFVNDRFTFDTFAQFFIHEDGINGALGFADAESVPQFTARNTAVVRAVAKFKLAEPLSLEAGFSFESGTITSRRRDIATQHGEGIAFDGAVRYTIRPDLEARVFGEWLSHQGAISPYRYVSGGASERIVDTILGAQLKHGPVAYRSELSVGQDTNPNGRQKIWIHGATIAIAKNADLYIERVRWKVRPAYLGYDLLFDNGWEVVLNWRM